MMAISNLYLTHGVMLLCALAAAFMAIPESTGRIVAWWRVPTTALLVVISALVLVAYPTWGELKNPALWMFILASIGPADQPTASRPARPSFAAAQRIAVVRAVRC